MKTLLKNVGRHSATCILYLTLLVSLMIPSQGRCEDEKLKFTPVGTLLLDGAVYAAPDKKAFPAGVAIPETRLGVIADYGKWSVKIEAGLAYNKVALRDVYFQYRFDSRNMIRLGAMVHHFGYQNCTAACNKVTMIEPITNSVFNQGQMIGVQYYHMGDRFFATGSLHALPDATRLATAPSQIARSGWGVRSRLVWHPFTSEGRLAQIGITGALMTPDRNGIIEDRDLFTLAANFPTKVAQVQAVSAKVTECRTRWQFTPELMGAYGPVGIEGQYVFAQLNRRDNLPAFRAYGAYVTLRGLILGGDYTYSKSLAGIATPRPHSLELLATYNYTCLSDASAGIFGGRVNDLAVVAGYYINRWLTARLRYGYTWVRDRAAEGPHDLGALQARLQIIF